MQCLLGCGLEEGVQKPLDLSSLEKNRVEAALLKMNTCVTRRNRGLHHRRRTRACPVSYKHVAVLPMESASDTHRELFLHFTPCSLNIN